MFLLFFTAFTMWFRRQPLARHLAAVHAPGAAIQLEYMKIPQVEETLATLGSSPYWCWGYEMGALRTAPRASRPAACDFCAPGTLPP